MDEIIEMLKKYESDFETMNCEEIKEVIETLDAFINDYQIMNWVAEDVGYGL